MPTIQLSLTTNPKNAEALEDALLAAGALCVTLNDNADQPLFEPGVGETPLWDSTLICGLFDAEHDMDAVVNHLQKTVKQLPAHHIDILEDKDWVREWMTHYKPMCFGERLWICPSWTPPPNPDAVNLLLDPGLAFGTGTHPTTALCLRWLDAQNLTGKTVIDYGCGSGILAIAALLLGADHAICVDNDPQALTATLDNAERNNIDLSRLTICLPENMPALNSEELADVFIANILAGPLINLAEKFATLSKPNAPIVLSGILANQAAMVSDAYSAWFDMQPATQDEDWVRLNGVRK
jgi:ribosomal protein L11 methyltransferase